MATTTNYGWTTPDDTDLVKDGAAAIRTLGSSVDTTTKALNPETTTGDIAYRAATANTNTRLALGTAGQVLKVNSGATAPEWGTSASGLTLIKEQTIGTAVSSVAVTDAFSSTYDNYKIILTGGAGSGATSNNLGMILGATTTGYSFYGFFGTYNAATVTGANQNNGAKWEAVGTASTNGIQGEIELWCPNLAKTTQYAARSVSPVATSGLVQILSGFLNNTTQYTGFTIDSGGSTMTGGTIRVYGYQNS
jgi:hypothetical protein